VSLLALLRPPWHLCFGVNRAPKPSRFKELSFDNLALPVLIWGLILCSIGRAGAWFPVCVLLPKDLTGVKLNHYQKIGLRAGYGLKYGIDA
jgi:hypothetical protein